MGLLPELETEYPEGSDITIMNTYYSYPTYEDGRKVSDDYMFLIYKDNKYKTETIHDDYDFVLRLKKQGAKFSVLNKTLANFTMNGVSHERNLNKMLERIKIKYKIYRDNGYSRLYIFECVIVELAKFIAG